MTPAPPFECHRCRHRIGQKAAHYLIEGNRIVCRRCLGQAAHDDLFPDCGVAWHDVLDHPGSVGTRAGVAAYLDLWPET